MVPGARDGTLWGVAAALQGLRAEFNRGYVAAGTLSAARRFAQGEKAWGFHVAPLSPMAVPLPELYREMLKVGEFAEDAEREVQAQLLRCIFGNPFRPITLDPSWLTPTVVSLTNQMYDSRDFSAMSILADALQDANCDNQDVLNHCRGPGPHVRGCWVLDLLTNRE